MVGNDVWGIKVMYTLIFPDDYAYGVVAWQKQDAGTPVVKSHSFHKTLFGAH